MLQRFTLYHVFILVLSTSLLSGQSPGQIQADALKGLSWMVGEWEGTAWTQMGAQQRDTFQMTEIVHTALEGTILEVEGIGRDQAGSIAHHAKAVISYNVNTRKLQWHAWRIPGGIFSEYEPQITENGFKWAMEVPSGNIRYSVTRKDADGWFEIGEFSGDGEHWIKFFEMNLKRKR